MRTHVAQDPPPPVARRVPAPNVRNPPHAARRTPPTAHRPPHAARRVAQDLPCTLRLPAILAALAGVICLPPANGANVHRTPVPYARTCATPSTRSVARAHVTQDYAHSRAPVTLDDTIAEY
ncbi:hypothetical protein GGX14DRAFT_391894 [Mycena pura]|uniref:Uncharacterized protein n=1 Tax=Mycena pura TaxID=153505 RepID=A0AAD6VLQ9_9AGAR|nr:hypothetical protein GGX14DRAFT_391894 [Mycena pura]